MKTYSLEEAALQLCGDSMKDPTLWLRRKIRQKVIRASRVGHQLRMNERQIEDAFIALEVNSEQKSEPAEPTVRLGITSASLRRRVS